MGRATASSVGVELPFPPRIYPSLRRPKYPTTGILRIPHVTEKLERPGETVDIGRVVGASE